MTKVTITYAVMPISGSDKEVDKYVCETPDTMGEDGRGPLRRALYNIAENGILVMDSDRARGFMIPPHTIQKIEFETILDPMTEPEG